MKCITFLGFVFMLVAPALGQSKYGLRCVLSDGCTAVDQKAEERMTNAKTICSSDNSSIVYHKGSKPPAFEMNSHWRNMNAAAAIAEHGYAAVLSCTQADLIIRLVLDITSDNVSIEVTDADSGESVFEENRSIHDESNDLSRLALHFRSASMGAKMTERTREREAEEAERQRKEYAKQEEETRRCNDESDSLRDKIVSVAVVSHQELPSELFSQITEHNRRCSPIVVERVIEYAKAEASVRLAEEIRQKQELEARSNLRV